MGSDPCRTEIDLPEVVAQKRRLLERAGKRRPHLVEAGLPTFLPSNLSERVSSRAALAEALRPAPRGGRVLFVCEALLI